MYTAKDHYEVEQDPDRLSDMDIGNNGDEEENNKGIKEARNGVRCVFF